MHRKRAIRSGQTQATIHATQHARQDCIKHDAQAGRCGSFVAARRLIRSTVIFVTQSGSTNPRRARSDGESRTERTIGMKPIISGLVRMMEEKAENLNLEPFEKMLK